MTTWAFLTINAALAEPKRSDLVACIELEGWRPLESVAYCWYRQSGDLDQLRVVRAVRELLETALLTIGSHDEVAFAVHTGQSTPHVGSVMPAKTQRLRNPTRQVFASVYRRTKPLRTPHTLFARRATRPIG